MPMDSHNNLPLVNGQPKLQPTGKRNEQSKCTKLNPYPHRPDNNFNLLR